MMNLKIRVIFQPAFGYLKLTVETVEQGVKYVQSLQWKHQNDAHVQ